MCQKHEVIEFLLNMGSEVKHIDIEQHRRWRNILEETRPGKYEMIMDILRSKYFNLHFIIA